MRISLKQQNNFWVLRWQNKKEVYSTFDAATTRAQKVWKRYYKECAAYSMAMVLHLNCLSVKDTEFVVKLRLNNCKGITTAQYGYLKGIYERQQREW